MTKYISSSFLALIMILTFSFAMMPITVSAQGLLMPTCEDGIPAGSPPGTLPTNPCTFNSVVQMAQEIATAVVKVALFVAPLIFAYAGYLLVASGSSPGKRDQAKKIFMNVVIGLAIMLAAWLIVNLVLTALINPSILNNSAFPFAAKNGS